MSVPTAGNETQNVRKARALSAENVTKEYLELAAPNQGSIIYEDGYRVREHQAEIEMVREAAKQIAAIPGGIILDSSASALAMEEIESEVRQRFKRVSLEAVDVMVVSKGQLRLIMRYKK